VSMNCEAPTCVNAVEARHANSPQPVIKLWFTIAKAYAPLRAGIVEMDSPPRYDGGADAPTQRLRRCAGTHPEAETGVPEGGRILVILPDATRNSARTCGICRDTTPGPSSSIMQFERDRCARQGTMIVLTLGREAMAFSRNTLAASRACRGRRARWRALEAADQRISFGGENLTKCRAA